MVSKRRFDIKEKSVYTKEWEVESRDNPVTPWCTDNRTWKKMEDNRVNNKKLLIARNNKRYWKIYGQMWYISEDKELDGGISRKVNGE